MTVEIETGVVTGKFPSRAPSHLLEWKSLHQRELLDDWTLARQRMPLMGISPLE